MTLAGRRGPPARWDERRAALLEHDAGPGYLAAGAEPPPCVEGRPQRLACEDRLLEGDRLRWAELGQLRGRRRVGDAERRQADVHDLDARARVRVAVALVMGGGESGGDLGRRGGAVER